MHANFTEFAGSVLPLVLSNWRLLIKGWHQDRTQMTHRRGLLVGHSGAVTRPVFFIYKLATFVASMSLACG